MALKRKFANIYFNLDRDVHFTRGLGRFLTGAVSMNAEARKKYVTELENLLTKAWETATSKRLKAEKAELFPYTTKLEAWEEEANKKIEGLIRVKRQLERFLEKDPEMKFSLLDRNRYLILLERAASLIFDVPRLTLKNPPDYSGINQNVGNREIAFNWSPNSTPELREKNPVDYVERHQKEIQKLREKVSEFYIKLNMNRPLEISPPPYRAPPPYNHVRLDVVQGKNLEESIGRI